ncbi:unnamed protein product [Schistosoma curassoni]|uniref:DUF4817 domain-containing protein n=1 Tax=Schistosoma curassoni TaxID=6186 RepID=A0A183KXZ7_9TREM|nr:unnamed protein product [Schistosoma curassoni]
MELEKKAQVRLHISYGSLVARALNSECTRRLIGRFDANKEIITNIRQTAFILRYYISFICLYVILFN